MRNVTGTGDKAKEVDGLFSWAGNSLGQTLSHIESIIRSNSIVAVHTLDPKGTIHKWSPASEHLYGYSSDEVIGRRFQDVLLSEQASDHFEQKLKILLELGQATELEQLTVRTRSGRERRVYAIMVPIGANDVVEHIICMGLDIADGTEQAKIKEETPELFHIFMDQLSVPALIKDAQGRVLYVNQYLKEKFGADSWIMQTAADYYPREVAERILEHDRCVLAEGPLCREEWRPDKNGKIRCFRVYKFPIKQPDKPLLLGCIGVEVTEHKKVEAQLLKIHEELEKRVQDRTDKLLRVNRELTEQMAERKRAEKALDYSEAIYRKTIETAQGVPYQVRYSDGTFIFIGSGVEELLGISAEEITHERYHQLIQEVVVTGEDPSKGLFEYFSAIIQGRSDIAFLKLKKHLGAYIRGEVRCSRADLRIRTQNAGEKWISDCATLVWDEETGRIVGAVGILQDITYRKQTECKLQESEEQHRAIFEQAVDSIVVFDAETGEIVKFNDSSHESLGYTREEFKNLKISDFEIIETTDEIAAHIKTIIKKGVDVFETKHRTKNGQIRDILVSEKTISVGGKHFIQGVWRDITEQKKIEKSLQESKVKYKELVHNANSIIMRRDINGKISFFNEFAQRFFGYSKEEIIGENVVGTIIPETDRGGHDLSVMVKDISKNPEAYISNENENIRRNGERVWISWTNKPVRNEQGKIIEILCVGNDITARKRAEEALEIAHRELNQIFRVAPPLYVIDKDMNILQVNDTFCSLLDLDRNNTVGRKCYDVLHETLCKTGRCPLINIMGGANKYAYETKLKNKSGKIINCIITTIPYYSIKGDIVAFVNSVVDVTEQIRVSDELRKEMEERRQLERELLDISEREKRLIGQELHDSIGQQLLGIGFMTKVLENRLANKSAAETDAASEITVLVKEAIKQTRNLARGLHPIDLHSTGLHSALAQLAVTAESLFGVNCKYKCKKSILIDGMEVAVHVYRIAQEAITNAARHGKAKNIKVWLTAKGDKCILSVQSDGLDFPEGKVRNGGMGLKIMEYRTEMIGGSLDVRRGNRGGTILTCVFSPEKCKCAHQNAGSEH